jgi:hypothetical protein
LRVRREVANRLTSTFDWETTMPEYALGYRFAATPMSTGCEPGSVRMRHRRAAMKQPR